VFQFATMPAINAEGLAGVAPWQALAHQWFQALVRAPAASDPTLAGSGRETVERALASQLLLSQPASDSLDALTWEEAGSELDRQEGAEWSALSGPPGRRDARSRIIPPTIIAPAEEVRAALDQVFAQTADDE
jgi:hypothetical protein